MKRNRLAYTGLSLVTIVGLLLSPLTALAAPISISFTPASSTFAAVSQPAAKPSAPATIIGQVLFAPTIDADGDPATNPIEHAPVIDLLGQTRGLISLAAQLQATDPKVTPIGVDVTFKVWNAQGTQFEQSVRSDAWGAVAVEVHLDEVAGDYSYQASAPGYGETEVRRFQFEPKQVMYTLHRDGAQLMYQRQPSGAVLFTLRSPKPLQAERDEANLVIVRRPYTSTVDLQGLGLPFPAVTMRIVGTYTATLLVSLPTGDYSFLGSLAVNSKPAEHFYSQPLPLTLDRQPPQPTTEAIWASDIAYEADQKLVQYRAPNGQVVFDLAAFDQVPDLNTAPPAQRQVVKTWRTGPFSWEQEQYDIHIETRVDDRKKSVTLQDFDYDPIARRYTLAIESKLDQTLTDTLRVSVLGPGSIVIKQEVVSVTLPANGVLHYSVEVPAELGKPYGLRVTLDDPEDVIISVVRSFASVVQSFVGFFQEHGTFSATIRAFAEALGVTLVECKGGTTGSTCDVFPYTTSASLFVAIEKWLFKSAWDPTHGRFVLGSAGLEGKLNLGLSFTVSEGKCPDPQAREVMANKVQLLATGLDAQLGKVAADLKPDVSDPLPFPIFYILLVWFRTQPSFNLKISASDLTIKAVGNLSLVLAGDIGLGINISTGLVDALKLVYRFITSATAGLSLITGLIDLENWQVPQKNCDPEPPDPRPPDDRQDVWQGIEQFYQGQTHEATINNLSSLLQRTQAHQLDRAERYLTLALRRTELAQFTTNIATLEQYVENSSAIVSSLQSDLQGMLSGTVPISPSQTITEAFAARSEQASADLNALPYAHDQQQLMDAVAVAEQRYGELQGQELDLQAELRELFTANVIGVIDSGFPQATLSALNTAGLPSQLISLWPSSKKPYYPPALAPRALVIPSGGLHALAASPEARAWLDEYVSGGGLLIVFTQAFGDDWTVLPGGEVHGVGYEEDQRWQHATVDAASSSNWLVWMGIQQPDIQIDGAFTSWPAHAQVLLTRTFGKYAGSPVIVEYTHGAGRVLATTAYGDWAWQAGNWWGDDWQMTRSILLRAYLLTQGQDVPDLAAADPASAITVSFPVTNTSTYTATAVKVILSTRVDWIGQDYRTTVPLTLAPGASMIVTATLPTPPLMRNVHNWTQIGLYRLQLTIQTLGERYAVAGPFIYVRSPIAPREVLMQLTASPSAPYLGERVVVTTTLHSNVDVTHTLTLLGEGLESATPVTITLAPHAEATYTATVLADSSKSVRVTVLESNKQIAQANLTLNIQRPPFRVQPDIPPRVQAGASITVPVRNTTTSDLTSFAALSLTLKSPDQTPLWTSAESIPALAAGQTVTPTFTVGALGGVTDLDNYRLEHAILIGDQQIDSGASLIPARVEVAGNFDRTAYHVREVVSFTASVSNTGFFDLAIPVTLTVPGLGIVVTNVVTLSAGDAATLPLTFTLPTNYAQGTSIVEVSAGLGQTLARRFTFTVPPSHLQIAADDSLERAITLTLTNDGGVDTIGAYDLQLRDPSGQLIIGDTATRTLQASVSVPISFTVPAGLTRGYYWLMFNGRDQATGQTLNIFRSYYFDGPAADLFAQTDRPTYLTGDPVSVTGQITTTSGVITGNLTLQVERSVPSEASVGPDERVNDGHDPALFDQWSPAVAMDAAGNTYAVWIDQRGSDPWEDDVYFARRPAGGVWGPNEIVNDVPLTNTQIFLDIAVDAAGTVYVVWNDSRSGDSDVYFAYRPVTGTWSANVRINDDSGTQSQDEPKIAVDAAGNAYAAWYDRRIGSNGDIYFAYRPTDGVWGVNERVTPTSPGHSPDIAVDASGNAYVAWAAFYTWNVQFAYRSSSGVWTSPTSVPGTVNSTTTPSIGVDGSGNAYLVWQSTVYDVYTSYRLAGGSWGARVRLDDGFAARQYTPHIAVEPGGTAYAVWADDRFYTGAARSSYDIYFAYRSAGGTWGPSQRFVDSPMIFGYPFDQAVAIDPAGNVQVIWEDRRYDHSDIFASFKPSGGSWNAGMRVNDDVGGTNQMAPALATDPVGNVYTVWYDQGSKGVYFAWRPAISTTWSANERVSGSVLVDPLYPDIAVDSAGNVYVAWIDNRNGISDYDLYFAYRPVGGAWSAPEQINDDGSASSNAFDPSLNVDAAGNVYVVWSQMRSGYADPDIYFAYRPSGGVWSPNVRVNDVPTGDQSQPDLAVDAAGNAYAVWTDGQLGYFTVFAYRPAGGTWGPSVRVNSSGNTLPESAPRVTVDAAGTAYAVWDQGYVYMSSRPAGGPWQTPERLGAGSMPGVGVDAFGNLFVGYPHGNYTLNYRLKGTTDWHSLSALAPNHFFSDFTIDSLGHAYFAAVSPTILPNRDQNITVTPFTVTGRYVSAWQTVVPVNTSSVQPISETAGALSEPGKYWLQGEVRNSNNQVLTSARYPFYVYPTSAGLFTPSSAQSRKSAAPTAIGNVALTLDIPQAIYRVGQIVSVAGWLTNTSVTSATLPLTITTETQTLLTQTLTLVAGEGYAYTATLMANSDTLISAATDGFMVSDWIQVGAPQVSGAINAPDIAGRTPFSVSVVLTNTGVVPVGLDITFADASTSGVILQPGEVTVVSRTFVISADTLLTATLSGDVTRTLIKWVTQGEQAALVLQPPDSELAGLIVVPYEVVGTGTLATPVQLRLSLDGQLAETQTVIAAPGETASGSVPLDIAAGQHTIYAELLAQDGTLLDQGALTASLLPPGVPLLPAVRILNVQAAQMPDTSPPGTHLDVMVDLASDGPAGPIILGTQIFDMLQQWVVTPTAYLTQSLTFTLPVPSDLPSDEYFGEVSLDDQLQPFTVTVAGSKVQLGLSLDKSVYTPGEVATLTMALTNTNAANADFILMSRYYAAEGYITVTVPGHSTVLSTFPFTATQAGRATVFLSNAPSADGQRVLTLDSLPVQVNDLSHGVSLTHDRLIYDPGDTIDLTATITGTLGHVMVIGPMELALQEGGALMWFAPTEPNGIGTVLTGTYALSYTLPTDMRMGRYTFLLKANGQSYEYPVDVRGWKVTTRHVRLDKPRYMRNDQLTATAEFWNEGTEPITDLRLTAWLFTPDDGDVFDLTPAVSRTIELQPGLNVITVTGAFTTPVVGPHRLLINVGRPGWRVAGAATQLDIGSAHILDLTTDRGDYAPGELGVGQLDVYGLGSTHLIVTATNGSTLLDAQPDLSGFATFTFTLPTTTIGDYLLIATSIDQDGNSDQRLRAYAVPAPRDTQPPALQLTYPNMHTIITTPALTTTLNVTGQATDDSGHVTVLINGRIITPDVNGFFIAPIEIAQGINLVSAAALDPSDNVTYTRVLPVLVLPARGLTFSADRTNANVGQTLVFQTVLTTSGVLSDSTALQLLPTALVTNVVASASSGTVVVNGADPTQRTITWQGDVTHAHPVTLTVQATAMASGTLTQTVTAYWGYGVIEESPLVTITLTTSTSTTYGVYLPLVRK